MSKSYYIIPIFVPHEGCPHNCVFCNQSTITGSTTKVDEDFVRNTIEDYLSTIKNKNATIEVSFFGGTFTAIPMSKQNELLAVAKEYKEKGKIKHIRLSTRPDYIDDNILTNLKKYLVDIIELGVQSLDEEVLLKSGRGHTEKDVVDACNLITKYSFVLGVQIMLGLPGDNFEKDIDTTEKLIALRPQICRIYPALTIKNTPMEKLYSKGVYNPYTLEETIHVCKIIYGMFTANNVNVIRMGLQTTENINVGKEIVSGPFHPAFGELIEGSILNDMIGESVSSNYEGIVTIFINEKDISKLYCNKKKYFNDIKKQFNIMNIKLIVDNNLKRGTIMLKIGDKGYNLSTHDYLIKKYKEGYLNLL